MEGYKVDEPQEIQIKKISSSGFRSTHRKFKNLVELKKKKKDKTCVSVCV